MILPRPQLFVSKVISNEKINSKVNEVVLKLESPATIKFFAGQFVSVEVAEDTYRSYSISSAPNESECIKILVATAHNGVGSNYIRNLHVGDKVNFVGPTGHFVWRGINSDITMISTGTGIAPFLSMLEHFEQIKYPHKITVLHGIRTDEDLIHPEFLERLVANNKNLKIHLFFSQQQRTLHSLQASHGRVTSKLKEFCDPKSTYYICGNPNMVSEVTSNLLKLGIPESGIFTEGFTFAKQIS